VFENKVARTESVFQPILALCKAFIMFNQELSKVSDAGLKVQKRYKHGTRAVILAEPKGWLSRYDNPNMPAHRDQNRSRFVAAAVLASVIRLPPGGRAIFVNGAGFFLCAVFSPLWLSAFDDSRSFLRVARHPAGTSVLSGNPVFGPTRIGAPLCGVSYN
jgi:hypothetical protein